MEKTNNNKIFTVAGIILGGLLIVGAIIYIPKSPPETQTAGIVETENETVSIEHILGNPNAELTIILYFDINCHYCKIFHQTMHQLMNEYGKSGKLKWISKSFPLNPISQKQAEAAECAGELGGNEKFWEYLDKLVNRQMPAPEKVTSELIILADELNLNKDKFKQCLESGKYTEKIMKSGQEAIDMGAKGTPFGIIITKTNEKIMIPGALPYEEMEKLLEELLK